MTKLRLGVILPDVNVPTWIVRMLDTVKSSSYAEVISLAFAQDANQPDPLYERYFQLDARFFKTAPSPWSQKDVRQVLQHTQRLGESVHDFIARFKALRLDVILNLSLTTLPKSVSDAARFGVWSLRCNDGRVTTGTDFGWQELLSGEPLLQCAVEAQRAETLQAVARSVMAAHPYSFTQNQKSFLWRAATLIPHALRNLQVKGDIEFFSKAETLKPTAKLSRPTTSQIITLAWKQSLKTFETKVWRRWFPQRWALMAGKCLDEGKLAFDGLKLKVPPRGGFWADPFLIERLGKTYVFFEEFLFKKQFGHISFAEIQKDGSIGKSQMALERPYHLSYPFLFENRGEFYMIPETGQNRSIEVYRCRSFPNEWAYHKTLMHGVRAVDTTLLEHLGMWWMFVNMASEGGSTWDELHLFYADDPLSEHWTPHPLTPVVSDVRSARPAGRLFRREGLLLRPSQDSSLRYGYALNINRITKLTKYEYEEELFERLEPPKGGKFLAVHTLNSLHDLTVIDVVMR
ncbi:MAG: hypothetical protein QM730_09345 [Anaerolineales bacterium]